MPDTLELVREALTGRYRVERVLGEGGMATVYLALDERHRRQVAIKLLRPELTQTLGVDRFRREIEIAARLSHPHIVPLLDSGSIELKPGWPASAYYVMPYVPTRRRATGATPWTGSRRNTGDGPGASCCSR